MFPFDAHILAPDRILVGRLPHTIALLPVLLRIVMIPLLLYHSCISCQSLPLKALVLGILSMVLDQALLAIAAFTGGWRGSLHHLVVVCYLLVIAGVFQIVHLFIILILAAHVIVCF